MSQHGRYSLASSAAAAVMAGAANFAPPGGMASPNVYSPRGVAPPTTVQQTRTRGAAAASYYDYGDDDDFRYNEEGATASGVGRWPTFSLGSVILCVLVAMAVALGTNVRALTVVPADPDARALAARVSAVGESVDVMAKALAAEAKAAAKAGGAKAARAHARDLSALRDDVDKLAARIKSQEDAVARVQKNAEKKKPAPASTATPASTAADAKELQALKLEVAALTKSVAAATAASKTSKSTKSTTPSSSAAPSPETRAEMDALREEIRALRESSASSAASTAESTARELASLREELSSTTKAATDRDSELRRKMDGWRGKPMVTRSSVAEEVRQQMQILGADRTGMVDYALYSGGGKVVGHSALSPLVARGDGPLTNALKGLRGGVHPRADEWLLSAGSEAPGECLALEGTRGWVDVRLREAVAVDSITIEHVHPLVAYDVSSAPKEVAVSGWNRTKSASATRGGARRLGTARYDVASPAGSMQTFNMTEGGGAVVDHVRFEVRSNYGNADWTCLYRLRVHGTPVARPRQPVFD